MLRLSTMTLAAAIVAAVGTFGGADEARADCAVSATGTGNGIQYCGRNAHGDTGIQAFQGIQYATAPRWEPPGPPAQPGPQVQALNYGPICPQDGPEIPGTMDDAGPYVIGEEECLYLNVWKPATATAGNPAPVMVFIHGGAFIFGSSADDAYTPGPVVNGHADLTFDNDAGLYDGYQLARQGVVVVTLNYRLGALGFLYDSDRNIYGNFGILDQRAALTWVKDNIQGFGGDAGRITVFGESAGAMSVGLLAFNTDAAAKGLFHAAIMESNPLFVPYRDRSIEDKVNKEAVSYFRDYCRTLATGPQALCMLHPYDSARNADGITNLILAQTRKKDWVRRIIDAYDTTWQTILPWTPFLGDQYRVLADTQPSIIGFNTGVAKTIPLMFGTNRDEGVLFLQLMADAGKPLSKLEFELAVNKLIDLKDASDDGIRTPSQYLANVTAISTVDGTTIHPYCAGQKTSGGDHAADCTPPTPGVQASSLTPPGNAMSAVAVDLVFRCGTANAAWKASGQNGGAVSLYEFSNPPIFNALSSKAEACNVTDSDSGYHSVCHAYELPHVFSSLGLNDGSGLMTADWAAFARDPAGFVAGRKWTPDPDGTGTTNTVHQYGSLPPWNDFESTTIEKASNCRMWASKVVPAWRD